MPGSRPITGASTSDGSSPDASTPARPVHGAPVHEAFPRGSLNRAGIVAAAVALADEQGMAAVSMRALAGRLGVEAMSLYHHVPNKDALLDDMVDEVFSELYDPTVGQPWRPELATRTRSGRAVLLRHRWALGLMDARRTPGPHSLAHHDAVIGLLLAAGFSLPATGHAFALIDAYLYGFLLQEIALPFETESELAELGAQILDEATAGAYPYFTRFAVERAMVPGYSFGAEFEVGLELVLTAIASLHPE